MQQSDTKITSEYLNNNKNHVTKNNNKRLIKNGKRNLKGGLTSNQLSPRIKSGIYSAGNTSSDSRNDDND